MIDKPDCKVADLMRIMPGPDFPTGAYICGRKGIVDAYSTGRGRVVMRARVHNEQLKAGREAIVVTELPYQVNKATAHPQAAQPPA
jgi:DNA gyrase subunit A